MIRFLQTPGPLKKIVLGGVLLIICVAMLISLTPTGSNSTLGGPGRGVVATVDGEDVTSLEVEREARAMLQQQFPKGGEQATMLLPFFAGRAAQNLIQQKVVLAEARKLGLRATDEEVSAELRHNPQYSSAFFVNGNFVGQTKYEDMLQQFGMTVPQFEQAVRDQILTRKLEELVAGGASVSDAEIEQEFEKKNSKVKFDYAVLRKDDLLKDIHPAEAELRAYYDRHKANYANSIPEKRKIRYVVIDSTKLESQAAVSDQDLQAYYDRHQEEFRVPEQVNVRQILIKTPLPGTDGKTDSKAADLARQKAEDVLRQLKAGAKFEDLAKKYSDDPSASSGGSIGWINHGGFPVPEVDKAAFSLPKGGTSDIINAGYAFVILHVDDKQQAHAKALTETKAQMEPAIRAQKAAQAADTQASTLVSQARVEGLDKAAAGKGLQVITTNLVGRTDALPGIGNSPQFMDAAFSMAEKSPADEVQIPQGYAVFEVLEIKPPATPSFEEDRGTVENDFKNERVTSLLAQKTQELSDRAKADHDLKKAAREVGATIRTSDFVAQDAQVPDIGSMSLDKESGREGEGAVAFTLKPGEFSGPLNNGNTGVVLAVLEKQEPAREDLAAKKDQIRESLLLAKRGDLFKLFVLNAHLQMDKAKLIKENPQELKTLTGRQGQQGE